MVAQHLVDVLEHNVLFDVTAVPAADLVRRWSALFAARRPWAWPVPNDGDDELGAALERTGTVGHVIEASYGLSGWVLAERMQLVERARRVVQDLGGG